MCIRDRTSFIRLTESIYLPRDRMTLLLFRRLLDFSSARRWRNPITVSRLRHGSSAGLSLIHISEPTRLGMISYAVFCLKKKNIKHIEEKLYLRMQRIKLENKDKYIEE